MAAKNKGEYLWVHTGVEPQKLEAGFTLPARLPRDLSISTFPDRVLLARFSARIGEIALLQEGSGLPAEEDRPVTGFHPAQNGVQPVRVAWAFRSAELGMAELPRPPPSSLTSKSAIRRAESTLRTRSSR